MYDGASDRLVWPDPGELVRLSREECLALLTSAMPRAAWHAATLSPAAIGVVATCLTGPGTSSDAALILADNLREAAAAAELRRYVRDTAYLRFLENILRDAAPHLPGGECRP